MARKTLIKIQSENNRNSEGYVIYNVEYSETLVNLLTAMEDDGIIENWEAFDSDDIIHEV